VWNPYLSVEVAPDPTPDAFYCPQRSGRCQRRNRWLCRHSEAGTSVEERCIDGDDNDWHHHNDQSPSGTSYDPNGTDHRQWEQHPIRDLPYLLRSGSTVAVFGYIERQLSARRIYTPDSAFSGQRHSR
jgi:hypothetical protein